VGYGRRWSFFFPMAGVRIPLWKVLTVRTFVIAVFGTGRQGLFFIFSTVTCPTAVPSRGSAPPFFFVLSRDERRFFAPFPCVDDSNRPFLVPFHVRSTSWYRELFPYRSPLTFLSPIRTSQCAPHRSMQWFSGDGFVGNVSSTLHPALETWQVPDI